MNKNWYTARYIDGGKVVVHRGNGTEPVYFDLAALRAALAELACPHTADCGTCDGCGRCTFHGEPCVMFYHVGRTV